MVKISDEQAVQDDLAAVMNYIPLKLENVLMRPQGAAMHKVWDARTLVLDRDKFFDRFAEWQEFDALASKMHMQMKNVHTIVDAWPTALKLERGDEGAKEEFEQRLASGWTGLERFVEWKRVE